MREEKKFQPHGFTIFCDDLREEVSGKTTYVGVYGDAMFLDSQFPVALPSLFLAIHLFSEPGDHPSSLMIRVALPGEDPENPTINIELKPEFKLLDLPDIGDPLLHPRAHIVLKMGGSPFEIKQYGRVRVSALWDGEFVPLGSLAIAPTPPELRGEISIGN